MHTDSVAMRVSLKQENLYCLSVACMLVQDWIFDSALAYGTA